MIVIIIRGVYGLEYFRLLLNGILFISKNYKETLKNNSSYVAFKYLNEKRFGLLHSFIKIIDKICDCQKISNCKCLGHHFAIITLLQTKPFKEPVRLLQLSHLYEFIVTENVFAIPVENLLSVCFYINTGNKTFIAELVNQYENE